MFVDETTEAHLFADDGHVCVGIDELLDSLSRESSLTAYLVELIKSVIQSLTTVWYRAGEDWKLVDTSDEVVLQAELNELSFIDVVVTRREANAKRFQIDSMRHLRVNLEYSEQGGLRKVIAKHHELQALLAEMRMLRQVLEASCAHVNV